MGAQISPVLPPLMRKGGVEVLDGLLAGGLLRRL